MTAQTANTMPPPLGTIPETTPSGMTGFLCLWGVPVGDLATSEFGLLHRAGSSTATKPP
jgi:hypothetical protein